MKHLKVIAIWIFGIILMCCQTGCQKHNQSKKVFTNIPKLGIGWNLGNSLDCIGKGEKNNDDTQIMISFSTNPYSSWDASQVLNFKNLACDFRWDIKQLNSDKNLQSGSFKIQLINHTWSSGNVVCKMEDTIFVKKDGTQIPIKSMNGKKQFQINGEKTRPISFNISNVKGLEKAEDLLGGAVMDKSKDNKSDSKRKYRG